MGFPRQPTRCYFLQGIFPSQESKLHLLHWQVDSLPLSHLANESLHVVKVVELYAKRKTVNFYSVLVLKMKISRV